ncbi:MAG: sulfotransferase [Kiritimatiellae bacterium]|jgi:hypothetical protein|nr:sulfotransferase [Kiritimatiellia bacterium]
MSYFFITGAYRSGTTLLDKLLCSHPSLQVASQPFPLLFVAIKETFCQSIGYQGEQFPLSNYFREKEYCPEDVTKFLDKFKISKEFLEVVYKRLQSFSGTGDRLSNWIDILGQIETGHLCDIYRELLPAYFEDAGRHFGCKEILCEEFIPYFIQKGIRCIHITRDPRDMMCSLNAKKGHEFVGDLRPTLFNIHNWRKSVAFALQYESSPLLHTLRYEDLVCDPKGELLKITDFFGVEPYASKKNLLSENNHWKANSSFQNYTEISTDSVGRYKKALPESVIAFIEATCFAEMKYLGYGLPPKNEHEMFRTIKNFKEPYELERNNPPSDYSERSFLKDLETIRLHEIIHGGGFSPEQFVFSEIGVILNETI